MGGISQLRNTKFIRVFDFFFLLDSLSQSRLILIILVPLCIKKKKSLISRGVTLTNKTQYPEVGLNMAGDRISGEYTHPALLLGVTAPESSLTLPGSGPVSRYS